MKHKGINTIEWIGNIIIIITAIKKGIWVSLFYEIFYRLAQIKYFKARQFNSCPREVWHKKSKGTSLLNTIYIN